MSLTRLGVCVCVRTWVAMCTPVVVDSAVVWQSGNLGPVRALPATVFLTFRSNLFFIEAPDSSPIK